MSFTDFFAAYWWLMFPIFGMFMAVMGMFQTENRNEQVLRLIKSYVDQGKDPPPELLKLASQPGDMNSGLQSPRRPHNSAWTFVVFLALAAGCGVGYWYSRGEGYESAFLIVAVVMGVMAIGSIVIALISRRP